MPMRPFALSALLLFAALGCGVPDNSAMIAKAEAQDKAETAPKEPEKPPEAKPTDPKNTKVPETDPTKLGLIVEDTKVGDGKVAAAGDTCYILYRGTLKDGGKEFDSSAKHGNDPLSVNVGAGGVIKGWDLGIPGMREGGKRRLTIPADLAYGAQGQGDDIPPNSALVFDLELTAVLKPEDATVVERSTIKVGTGTAVKKGDVITVKTKGRLLNGTELDFNEGKPVQFKVGEGAVFPGMDLLVIGMKKGGMVNATVPPALGPTPGGPGGKIPAGAILKLEVTLVSID